MGTIEHFHFIRVWWLLALLPAAWLFWRLHSTTTSSSQWQRAVDPELLDHLLEGASDSRQSRVWLYMVAVAWLVCVLALAGPSWERREAPTYRNATERVLVIDLSRSMTVQDIKPNRLSRVKQKVEDILKKGGDVEHAVVVYAATPFVVSPLTNDAATILSMLPALEIDIMPSQGSRTGLALREAYDLLQGVKSRSGSVLLFTDSDIDNESMALASEMAANGIRLSVIGVGSADGAPIPHPRGGFVKDATGNIIVASLAEPSLRELASAGGGKYRRISADESDINDLLEQMQLSIIDANSKSSDRMADQWLDRGPWLMLLLLPVAAVSFRRGWL